MKRDLAIRALEMAIALRRPTKHGKHAGTLRWLSSNTSTASITRAGDTQH